jgi:hypothetical protein
LGVGYAFKYICIYMYSVCFLSMQVGFQENRIWASFSLFMSANSMLCWYYEYLRRSIDCMMATAHV